MEVVNEIKWYLVDADANNKLTNEGFNSQRTRLVRGHIIIMEGRNSWYL